ncbi:3-deoxy-D-manno-octulosonic acid transferase [Oceanibium sediminis]|uniref:3-deoxy-D-manno-octulosonic acid transferase n=1 Tax=Oceanibium sediminis TaxID=2026339 RepID=UPI000DD323F5|nr:3-deoxy-D-manno-octulosonic acid transferase [Oceanibium sediminis]
MGRSLALGIYLAASHLAGPVVRRTLTRRAVAGKEDPARRGERFGVASLPRPAGRLIWFHAASVGESVSLLGLIRKLLAQMPDVHVLLTTGTRTSAELMAKRLPDRAMHQFAPVDLPSAVSAFLAHWRPDLAVWTESELWPVMLTRTHARGCPMLLVNARVSARSARRMRWLGGYAASLLGRFERILAQDEEVFQRLSRLGADPAKLEVTGSLKDTAEALPYDKSALAKVRSAIGGRTVWLAASTHPGEEAMVSHAHSTARRRFQALLAIIAPRHPERGPQIAQMLRNEGWKVSLRSAGELPDRNTDIYIADTLGEMGLWYRIAAVSFVGGSLVPIGGHNPFEPALLGSAILTGPHVDNFETAYARFREGDAAQIVDDAEDLGRQLVATLPPDRAAARATAAWAVSSEGANVVQRVEDVIRRHLPDPAA